MKRTLVVAMGAMLVGSAMAASAAVTGGPGINKLSYVMGYQTGQAFKVHQVKVNAKQFAKGLKASMNDSKPEMTQAQMNQVMANFQRANEQKMQAKQMKESKADAEGGKVFLTANGKKAGVVTLPSGLQYKIIKKGTGAKPTATSKVTVDYEGRLTNGKVFDSSYARHQPATFRVDGVIKGWTQALQMMHEGATWMLYIPANLAYGKRGAGAMIGPDATLIFKVHLIKVDK